MANFEKKVSYNFYIQLVDINNKQTKIKSK